ncbi:MAG: Mutator MutT related protein [uncultured bacterium]|nr:MAG: Mutator MutT related protein [uncultured bacterium]
MKQVISAVKAIIIKNEKFLVIQHTLDDGTLFWDIPGGKIEFGESPYDALLRETEEETHLKIESMKPVGFWWFFRKADGHQVVCTTFICEVQSKTLELLQVEEEFKWVTKEEFLVGDYVVGHKSLKELIDKSL